MWQGTWQIDLGEVWGELWGSEGRGLGRFSPLQHTYPLAVPVLLYEASHIIERQCGGGSGIQSGCVTLGKSLNFSVPQLPHL